MNLKDLSNEFWLRNTKDVTDFRSKILKDNDNRCELTGELIKRPTLDHDHLTGRNRGVISQHNNTMEGYVLKYFNKYVKNHTGLNLPEWLRCLASYYEKSFQRGLHFRTIHDVQTKLSNMTKDQIHHLTLSDFNIKLDVNKQTKGEMMEVYLSNLIDHLENNYKIEVSSEKL